MKKLLAASLLFLLAGTGAFAQTGEDILADAEAAANPDTDMEAVLSMTISDGRGASETRSVRMYQRGSDQFLMRFLSPADIRGVALLIDVQDRDDDLIYLYLPAFRRERRIASHVKNEEFMGTGLTYEDIAEKNYSDTYEVVSWSRTGPDYALELRSKKEDSTYDGAMMVVDGESYLPIRTELLQDGSVVKRLTVEDVGRHRGYWYAEKTVVELPDSGRRTVMEIESIEHAASLDDALFSVRSLRRFR